MYINKEPQYTSNITKLLYMAAYRCPQKKHLASKKIKEQREKKQEANILTEEKTNPDIRKNRSA